MTACCHCVGRISKQFTQSCGLQCSRAFSGNPAVEVYLYLRRPPLHTIATCGSWSGAEPKCGVLGKGCTAYAGTHRLTGRSWAFPGRQQDFLCDMLPLGQHTATARPKIRVAMLGNELHSTNSDAGCPYILYKASRHMLAVHRSVRKCQHLRPKHKNQTLESMLVVVCAPGARLGAPRK